MPSLVALFLWVILLLALFCFDPAKEAKTSAALWVPILWIFFLGSRLPSQWINGEAMADATAAAEDLAEGDPINRAVWLVLLFLAIAVLLSRSVKWNGILRRNWILVLFLAYALVSVVWSDLPFVAFKKWFRDLGDYLMVLVALTDPQPGEAVCTVIRRLCYTLISIDILLIKYFVYLGRHFSYYTGATEYVGAATSKNTLGTVCLISGLYFFWDLVTRLPDHKKQRTKRIIVVNFIFLGMTLWVLNLSNSATSRTCLILGCLLILAMQTKAFQRRPRFITIAVPAVFLLYIVLAFGLGLSGKFAGAVGRDPTMTDRTIIWAAVLSVHTNPLVGAGYESFWLGPRLLKLWQIIPGINEAHDGYLEAYLNLGFIGLAILIGFLLANYRIIYKRLKPFSSFGAFTFAFWSVFLFHNVTEADFRSGPLWLTLLLAGMVIPERGSRRVRESEIVPVDTPHSPIVFPVSSQET